MAYNPLNIGALPMTAKERADQLLEAVQGFVSRAVKPLADQISQLQEKLTNLPTPKDGTNGASAYELAVANGFKGSEPEWLESLKGKPGEPVKGDKGDAGESIKGDPGESIKGDKGDAGKDGADAYQIAVQEGFKGDRAAWLKSLVGPVAEAMHGKDGKDGKDGEDGRDALQIDIVDIVEGRSYQRGQFGTWAGGLFRAVRKTMPVGESPDPRDWQLIVDGLSSIILEQVDERTVTVKIARSSGQVQEFKAAFPTMIDRGVYRPENKYAKGDTVSFGGSIWIAQRDTPDDKPGAPGKDTGWRLAVKAGRDGKDFRVQP